MARDYSQLANDEAVENAQKALLANGFKVEVVDSLQAAHDKVVELIPEGKEVFTATSVTLTQAGLDEELNGEKYVSVRNNYMGLYGQEDKAVEMRRIGSGSDYAVGSVHAVTEDGQVLVASNTGSQLPNYAYGASNVIWVVSTAKVVKDLNEAMERLHSYTFPLEDARAQKAYGVEHTVLSKMLLYVKDPISRVTVVLVKEPAGY